MEDVKKIEEAEAICVDVVYQFSRAWEALMDDAESEKLANELTTVESNISMIRNEIKQLPLVNKMDKEIEMRKLQQQVIVMRTQQQHRAEKVEEL